MKVQHSFYTRTDTINLAKELIGMKLFHRSSEGLTSGIIVETEAYCGKSDRGCHAYNNRLTSRTKVMFERGGVVYVYLCYGIHQMFNIVTHLKGYPHAILIRAIQPIDGIELMQQRRGVNNHQQLCSGPGKLGQAMGFKTVQSGMSLLGNEIWVEKVDYDAQSTIASRPRIGMNFNGYYKEVRWNFYLNDSKFVS